MAKIAFILLCHKDADGIIAQANRLTAAGDCIAIHFDARSPRGEYDRIRDALLGNPAVAFARRRVRCGWGEWSLVQATLNAVEAALDAFPTATHFYMLSGDCMPIKSAEYAHRFLDGADADYIESVDFFGSDWIKTGIKEERLIYRHWFNERTHKRLFYAALAVQQRLRLRRAVPADLQIMIGSQWWCLRRRTIEAVVAFCAQRPDVKRFFRTTWIPDETFFQTLVNHLVPEREIRPRTPTFLMFTDYGFPVTFYDDHY
ncbi:MAG: beta-1,6-N-acetylglucosaminyltransferase, partial [Gemmobacter sp.]